VNKTPKKTPKVMLVVCTILVFTTLFCFLVFETDVIYDIDISNFNNIGNELKRPISVEEVVRQLAAEDDDEGDDSTPAPVTPTPNPTPGPEPLPLPTPTPGDGEGQLVAKVQSIGIYDDQTQKGDGVLVDVRAAMDEHSTAHTSWWGLCYTNTGKVNSKLLSRASNAHVDSGVVVDGNSRPLIALGPRVMNYSARTYGDMHAPSSSEMHYGSVVDIVVEKNSTKYYIPAVVVDCKAHTYPTWIAQSGYAVSDGKRFYIAPGQPGNYKNPSEYSLEKANVWQNSVVEITAASSSLNELSEYSIIGVIVY